MANALMGLGIVFGVFMIVPDVAMGRWWLVPLDAVIIMACAYALVSTHR